GPGRVGPAAAGDPDPPDDDPLAAGPGRPAGGAGGDPGGDGGHQRLLEGGLLPAGSGRVRGLAGECPRRQAPPGTAQDRHPGRGAAGAPRRAAAAAAPLRPPTGDPAAAGRGPLPGGSGRGPDRRKAAGGAGCRVDAQIKLSVVASDIFGVSGRAMLAALVAGERAPKVLAQLARTRLRAKTSLWE